MPYVDKESGQIVVRIVYDGAPEAGKTTNLQQLCKSMRMHQRGELDSPASEGRRTEFFDWVDFSGGAVDGSPVRCQLVSVPGQTSLLRRRKYLLETADAVVFVADSTQDAMEDNRRAIQVLREATASMAGSAPVGIILQANKQDRDDAVRPDELAEALVIRDIPIIPASAATGSGVTQTFLMGVRLATDRVRQLLLDDALGEMPVSPDSAEGLYRAMVEWEAAAAKDASLEDYYEPVPEPVAPKVESRDAGTVTVVTHESDQRLIPWAPDILAGHLWPPVTGRAVLAAVNGSETTQVRETQPWAPAGATEIRSNRGWIVHTSDDWVHGDESAGRDGLIGMVRGWVGTRELIPEGRSLFLAKEEGRWRIWMISPHVETLHDSLDSALTGDDTGGLGNALVNMARVVDLTRGDSPEAVLLRDQALTSITVTDSGKIWCMDPLRMSADSNGTHDVVSQVRTLVLSRHQADPDGVAKRLRTALIAAKTKLAGGRTPPSIFDEIFA